MAEHLRRHLLMSSGVTANLRGECSNPRGKGTPVRTCGHVPAGFVIGFTLRLRRVAEVSTRRELVDV